MTKEYLFLRIGQEEEEEEEEEEEVKSICLVKLTGRVPPLVVFPPANVLDGEFLETTLDNQAVSIASFIFAGLFGIVAIYPNCKGDSHWTSTMCGIGSVIFLGCALDIMGVKIAQNSAWCASFLTLLFFGKWFIRAGAEEYLRVHASEHVHSSR